MARKVIDTGVVGNDGTGDSIRDSFRKVNENFRELYGALGLGTKLSFLSLDETPDDFTGQENAVLAVNPTESAMQFKQIVGGTGISIDFTSNENEIQIINTVASISADTNPRLGGNLQAQSGATQYRIQKLTTPVTSDEAVNKAYADTKVARAGVNAIDPASGTANSAFGTMTGPLILSRNPRPEDDVTYGGLIAATKNYVDNAGFGSSANLWVSTSGNDARVGVGASLQGRALAYAYRTLEAALKRAEEIVKGSRQEIGPYKKVLTFTNPVSGVTSESTLTSIDTSPDSGTGFAGRVTMTIDTITLALGGFNYQVGEILKINVVGGDEANAATVEILTVASEPGTPNGPILSFRLLTGGVFDGDLPGNTGVVVEEGSTYGSSAEFDITYKVNSAIIEDNGSGYGLVSVRVTGGGGTGAFGFADVTSGEISGVTITDPGSGFDDFPTLVVELPRFALRTDGFRTDFTGDVTTDSAQAKRGRDLREGLYLYGETSGALAQILAHSGELDTNGNELFDVDIKYGVFEIGESISYGDVANTRQIVVWVEAGIYYENLPLRVPQNVSIRGDEFRRSIIRPKPGPSSSPWAFINFRRDAVVDGLNTARNEANAAREDLYGYHYLTDADNPVYPLVDNRGYFRAASALLALNKTFIQEEVITWISKQIVEEISPFTETFDYNEDLCKRDVGLIIDAMCYDLLYGGSDRTLSAALKYRGNASGLIAITDQLSETTAAIQRVNTLAQAVIKNIPVNVSSYTAPVTGTFVTTTEPQIIDNAYVSEVGAGGLRITVSSATNSTICTITTSSAHGLTTGEIVTFDDMEGMTELNGNSYWISVANSTQFNIYSDQARTQGVNSTEFGEYTTSSGDVIPNGGVIGALTTAILDVISNSGAVNYPLDNDQMDIFLMNDATILRALSMQGQGGFAMVLDPEGQILAKSPYAQEGAVFSKSTGRQTFAGGMFVDGFAGNLQFRILSKDGNTKLNVGELKRFPQLPASFIVQDQVYRINYVRDFVYGTSGSTATLILDETTPWPYDVFTYNESICNRDVGLIIDGLGYDVVFGSNYHQRKAGRSYRLANAHVVIDSQLDLTTRATDYAHDVARDKVAELAVSTEYDAAKAYITTSKSNIKNIIRRGVVAQPTLQLPNPSGLATRYANAKALLLSNIEFIKDITVAYITATYPTLVYDAATCKRDISYIVESVAYDLTYGGNSQSRDAALKYFDGVGAALDSQLPVDQLADTADAITFAKTVAKAVIENTTVSTTYTKTAGTFVVGQQYTIASVGTTTNWTSIGASSGTIGVTFTATGVGSGDGTANVYVASTQVKDLANPSDSTTAAEIETLMAPIATVITTFVSTSNATTAIATVPAEVLPKLSVAAGGYDYDTYRTNARTTLVANKSLIQTRTIAFVNNNSNLYEILMPGNRSMLSNDFTQICDMGYGLIATNGGLTEAVSMFTYYCYTSYYSINGGQIRSVGGSSAHGVYALAAEGSDPLEVPTPVDLYYDLSQGATIYNDGGATYGNDVQGLIIYVSNYEYPPRNYSEIEIDHGGDIGVVRYPVVSATIENTFPSAGDSSKPVCRLNLNAANGGLVAEVPDGTDVTIRQVTETILTGEVVGVAVRPSTALKLNETYTTNLYRVLSFNDYDAADFELVNCTFTVSGEDTIVTTTVPHGQLPGYVVKFSGSTGFTLPDGLISGDKYYVLDDGFTSTAFKIATGKAGTPISTLISAGSFVVGHQYTIVSVGTTSFTAIGAASNAVGVTFTATDVGTGTGTASAVGTGTFYFEPTGLAITQLREGYDYVETTVYAKQPYYTYGANLVSYATKLIIGQTYKITSLGSTTQLQWNTAAGTTGITYSIGDTFTAAAVTLGTGVAVINSRICTFSQSTVNAGSFITGNSYAILTLGDTDWNTVAGTSGITYVVGDIFTAAAAGAGTGTAQYNYVTQNSHGFENGDIIRFETTDQLPTGVYTSRTYIVYAKTTNTFQIITYPGSVEAVDFDATAGSGTHVVAKVTGRKGDSSFGVEGLGTVDEARVLGMKFNWKGQNYTVSQYDSTAVTGELYARLYVTPALEDDLVGLSTTVSLLLGVAKRTEGSQGTLTIRIALTRVTSHDLLEIGTGSYADTNYPNEIYGPPVRIATETLLDTSGQAEYSQVVERGEGRCFFVTTDQFGNFSVGPFFRVDQGTGSVSFSASLALSNLSGLGFKRGVPIAEFSTDTSFSDNASDTVPTENATRVYIDRRLGVTHEGESVESVRLIPPTTGGFMALSGQLSMKGSLRMGDGTTNYRIQNLADPTGPLDAVNYRSVRFDAIIENSFIGQQTNAGYMIAFTGSGAEGRAVEITGDLTIPGDNAITQGVDSTLNQLNIYIKPDIIDNANINSAADIVQSKLLMTLASSRAAAPTGTAAAKQAASGLASFDSAQFTVTDGFATVKANGLAITRIAQIASETVLGNSTGSTGNILEVPFSSVVNQGGGIKKSQYSTTGFLRRTNSLTSSQDTDYTVVEAVSAYTASVDTNANGRLVIRDSSGDFAGRNVSAFLGLYAGTKKAVDTSTTATGGSVNLYGFGTGTVGSQVASITLSDGSLSTDKVSTYRNDNHLFRNNSDSGYAPIVSSQITAGTFTTGGSSTSGTLTGQIALSSSSQFDASSGTLKSTTLTTGAAGTAGTVTGTWSLGASSVFNADAGTLRSTTLSTGAAGTAGTITGAWTLGASSTLVASSIASQANSATITATSTNTANRIVLRDGSGNFSAGTISADTSGTHSGNVSTTSITTGGAGTAGTLTGNWSLASTSNITVGTGYLDARTGTLYSLTLNSGATATAGSVTGQWSVNAGSSFVASSISGQANSATTTATTANTGNTIVLRDGSGNFSAGTITATLNGSATTAGSITSQANSATINATSSNTANNIVLRDGSGNFSAGVMSGTATAARYADLAERYETDKEYAPGTVVVFGGDKEITTSNVKGDTRVAGVISTNPAHLMNSEAGDDKTHPPVALTGRVPCRVVGKIKKGDILVCAGVHGVAVAGGDNIKVGSMIGKALENYDSDHIGTIEIVVGRT